MDNNSFSVNSAQLRYEIFRNITTEKQKNSNTSYFVGVIKSTELLDLPDAENVRRFLGNKDKATGNVQKAILSSMEDRADEFSLLNGGVTLVAHSAKIENSHNRMILIKPSIINGSQTRGVLNVYHQDPENPPIDIKFELIVSTDDDLIADISIARNYQTKVKDVSIAGRKGAFVPLNSSLEKAGSVYRLNEDESDKSGIEPSLALQAAFLMMPESLWTRCLPKLKYVKSGVYSSTAKWLTIYSHAFEGAEKGDEHSIELMDYFTDVVAFALDFYFDWKKSDYFKGTKISNGIKRDENRNILDVKNGWIFPIIAGHSPWMNNHNGKWEYQQPSNYDPKRIIEVVKQIYNQKPDVNALGKNPVAYSMTEFMSKSLN